MHSKHSGEMNRRGFLRAAGGIAAAAALGQACRFAGLTASTEAVDPTPFEPSTSTPTLATPMATAMPSPTPESLVGRVALVRTTDRSEGVRRALELLGLNPVDGRSVFIKPNFNSADPAPGSTHDEVLRTLVEELWEMGARSMAIGDRSGMGDTRWVMQTKGAFDLADEFGMETVVFDDLSADDWLEPAAPDGSHWRRGFRIARPVVEAEAVVQTCNLKTHRFGGHFTLSLKNSVGLVAKSVPGEGYNYMTELHDSPDQRRMIAEINTGYTPALVVLDGVEAFVNGGPDVGDKVEAGVMLAGVDRVAIDAVAVSILRDLGTTANVRKGPVFQQEQIARAVELGLGAPGPEAIRIVAENSESQSYVNRLMGILAGPGE